MDRLIYDKFNIQMILSMFIIITIARRHRNIQTHFVVCCSSLSMLLNLWNFALILSFERCLSKSFAKQESSKSISESFLFNSFQFERAHLLNLEVLSKYRLRIQHPVQFLKYLSSQMINQR